MLLLPAALSKRLELTAAGHTLVGMPGGKFGPNRLTTRKEYSTTMALSTLKNLLVTQKLRRGDGPFVYPQSRRNERLFGEHGRSKRQSSHIKLEKLLLQEAYDPRKDSCLKAFVRLMAQATSKRDVPASD